MSSLLELQASKVAIGASGQLGTKVILPLDVDKIVTSANMKVGAYTIDAQPTYPCKITVTHTAVGTVDTLGTIDIVGTAIDGTAVSETLIPVSGTTVSTINEYASITSATGVDWVIDAVEETEDTITIGMGSITSGDNYFISAIQILSAAVVASQTIQSGNVVADLTAFTTIPVGIYPTRLTDVEFTSGEGIAYLQVI